MSNSTSTPAAKYFDLHTFGLGYVEDIRDVQVQRGRGSFLACRFSAFRYENNRTRFDLKVVGAHAKACVNAMKGLSGPVIAQIKIGDVYPEVFTYPSGERQGEMGVNIKGRVLKVYSATCDGQPVELLPPMPYSSEAKAPPAGLVTSGVGYLNRVSKVHMGEGEHVWMASISALRGDSMEGGKVENTRFVLAVGPDALDSIMSLQDALLAKKKVMVGFKVENIYPELFQYQKGEKRGQTDAMLKGALARISWAKVDGGVFPLTAQTQAA